MMHRILHMLGIARITLIDDSGPIQMVQIDEGPDGAGGRRILNKIKRFSEYGFYSVPPLKSEVFLGRLGGLRQQTIAIGTNHQTSRPKNKQPGDSGIFNGVTGAIIEQTADGLLIDCAGLPAVIRNASDITLTASGTITLDAPNIECTGNLKVDKLVTGDDTPVELGALRDTFNAHTHGGVKVGGDTSSGPSPTV